MIEKWTIEKIKDGFNKFYRKYRRYPTAHEIDAFEDLPSSRQIQRKFGGLPKLRKDLALDGPHDFTKGSYSRARAKKINKRGHVYEEEVYSYLMSVFGKEFIHREYFFIDDKRTRTDFFIYHKDGNFSVDVFYPETYKTLIGCLNSKMRSHKSEIMIDYPVIFLMMNSNIGMDEIEKAVRQKKNSLLKHQSVMSFNQCKVFCSTKKKSCKEVQ